MQTFTVVMIYYKIKNIVRCDAYFPYSLSEEELVIIAQDFFDIAKLPKLKSCHILFGKYKKTVSDVMKVRRIRNIKVKGDNKNIKNINMFEINNKTKRLVKYLTLMKLNTDYDTISRQDYISDSDESYDEMLTKADLIVENILTQDAQKYDRDRETKVIGQELNSKIEDITQTIEYQPVKMESTSNLIVGEKLTEKEYGNFEMVGQLNSKISIEEVTQTSDSQSIEEVEFDSELDDEGRESIKILKSMNFLNNHNFIIKGDRVILKEPVCWAYGDFIKNRKRKYISKTQGIKIGISRIGVHDLDLPCHPIN
jgi:hypothetical protein